MRQEDRIKFHDDWDRYFIGLDLKSKRFFDRHMLRSRMNGVTFEEAERSYSFWHEVFLSVKRWWATVRRKK